MNNYKDEIICILDNADNSYVSGSQISNKLNISRNMVWKYVKQLIDEGNIIESSRKGYRLVSQNSAFSSHKIKKQLTYDGIELEIFDIVDSTNTLLRKKAEEGAKEKTVVISAQQTSGRGRMGRSFYSPNDSGIYMSILLRPNLDVKDAVLVTTCAAVCVCRAIEKLCKVKAEIKWVNDIFISGKKVCGILTEAAVNLESSKPDYVVLGIGLNLYKPKNDFPDDLKNIATALFKDKETAENNKNRLVAEILNCFFDEYELLSQRNYYNEYKERMFLIGKKARVLSANEYIAQVVDIDENFSLIVQNENNEIIKLNSGEVSTSIY